MHALQDGLQGQGGPQMSRSTEPQFQLLFPYVWRCLEVVVQNEFEESTAEVTSFVLDFVYPDCTGVALYLENATRCLENPSNAAEADQSENILRGRILEAFTHWVRQKSRELDAMVFTLHTGQHAVGQKVQSCKKQLEESCYHGSCIEILADFFFSTVVGILGMESACLGSLLAGQLMSEYTRQELFSMCEWPAMLLAVMVCKLEELQSKVSKIVMELYQEIGFQSYEDTKHNLMVFFHNYSVETSSGTLEVHEAMTDRQFIESPFRVQLIDCYGRLLTLLHHLEFLSSGGADGHKLTIAVDFEGVKLCRTGPLCLVQMTCSDNPTLVYVLDVHVLGKGCFDMMTPAGTSIKSILESEGVRKVWFDPRNDVDALYHQFGIMPGGIFDLQLAEVVDRQKRGLNVNFVQGLYKCLTQCPGLQDEQKAFAEKINGMGKSLFEPSYGGNYTVFLQRPLVPILLVYAAHDSRYMLLLYEQYLSSIGEQWVPRVLRGGADRARWCLNPTYVVPNSDAPTF